MVPRMVILIVEDQAVIGLAIAMELQDAGHEILGPVTTIEAAERLAHEAHPALALIDIDLQRHGDGIDLARSLRSASNIQTLFITGRPIAARANADLALGVIEKPFVSSEIPRSIAVLQAIMAGGSPPSGDIPSQLELFRQLH